MVFMLMVGVICYQTKLILNFLNFGNKIIIQIKKNFYLTLEFFMGEIAYDFIVPLEKCCEDLELEKDITKFIKTL